ncbi:MAG: pantetheine-phosphate adenylyltransferase [Candidatus Omnitrophica bacterium]|jgi:pantetheine-phosphate adenylyltransferase|nr:pantetheine-phosphate adenylyltransferase [Candidatus Omnitrophota bacterium]
MTYGHLDIIKRAREIFEEVIVVVAQKPNKDTLFTFKERLEFIKRAVSGLDNVSVEGFSGLTIDYAAKKKVKVLIRGLRMISDFEYEFQMALTNRKLSAEVETIFLMPHESYSYLSSKLIKEAASLGANLSPFVPDFVEKALKKKLR